MSDRSTLLIGGHRKSGTSVLHSLFDGHDEIYAPPHDLNILYAFYPGWTSENISRDKQEKRLKRVTIADWKPLYLKAFGNLDQYNALELYINSNIQTYDLSNPVEVLDFIISALWNSVPDSVNKLIVKETSTELHVPWLFQGMPELQFLHLIRDPRDNYSALAAGQKNYYEKLGDDSLGTLTSTIIRYKLGIHSLSWNKKEYGKKKYRSLRFEDLTSNPTQEMKDIASWLGVAWSDVLTMPTRGSNTYMGNSHDGKVFSGLSSENVNRWKERISLEEAAVLEHVLSREMNILGYKREINEAYAAKCASEWYAQMNFKYFFSDRFKDE